MEVDLAGQPDPGTRRNPDGGGDSCKPLEHHEDRKQTAGLCVDLILMLPDQLFSAGAVGLVYESGRSHDPLGADLAQQAATEYRSGRAQGGAVHCKRDDGVAAVISSRVAARGRDSAAELQVADPIVQKSLAGRAGVESADLDAVAIFDRVQSGDDFRISPELAADPVLTLLLRRVEQQIYVELFTRISNDVCQFLNAGGGAGTLRMRKDEQRRAIGGFPERRSGRPAIWWYGGFSRCVGVTNQNPYSGADRKSPNQEGSGRKRSAEGSG